VGAACRSDLCHARDRYAARDKIYAALKDALARCKTAASEASHTAPLIEVHVGPFDFACRQCVDRSGFRILVIFTDTTGEGLARVVDTSI
jgi:hypothetical protein